MKVDIQLQSDNLKKKVKNKIKNASPFHTQMLFVLRTMFYQFLKTVHIQLLILFALTSICKFSLLFPVKYGTCLTIKSLLSMRSFPQFLRPMGYENDITFFLVRRPCVDPHQSSIPKRFQRHFLDFGCGPQESVIIKMQYVFKSN